MSKKKSFVLRIDPDLLEAIEKWAADEFRSTNGQLEWLIHRSLKEAGRLNKKSKSAPAEEDTSTDAPEASNQVTDEG